MKKHKDRPSCEVSCTLTLDKSEDTGIWPIFIEQDEEDIPVHLDIGEAMIYRGCETKHWREELEGEYSSHVFLHYVEENGENASYQFDKRTRASGQKNFRATLQLRLKSFQLLKQLKMDSTISAFVKMKYEIEQVNKGLNIVFDNKKSITTPPFLLGLLEELNSKENSFQPINLEKKTFDKLALDLLRKLIALGYFNIEN